MQLALDGHPIHTRALSVSLSQLDGGKLGAVGELLDLRKRGFTPVGTELQGAGVIHQMGLDAVLDAETLVLERIAERLSVVAFEASAATLGESCRDVEGRLAALVGRRVDERDLRDTVGGALGCSHILALAQFLLASAAWGAGEHRAAAIGPSSPPLVHRRFFRRDLIVDGTEVEAGTLTVGLQLSDLLSVPAAATVTPAERFAVHAELRVQMALQGWPATITQIRGARRRRERTGFAEAPWTDCGEPLAGLRGMTLGKGANQELTRRLDADPPLRDALRMLMPALIQCRASFPDKWLNAAATAPGHPGLIGMADSCYMWRRGGALEQGRSSRG